VVEELEEIKERLKRIEEKIRELDDRVGQLENIAVVTMVNAADKRFLGEEAKRSKRRRG
jgi:prefoldin subunit 5